MEKQNLVAKKRKKKEKETNLHDMPKDGHRNGREMQAHHACGNVTSLFEAKRSRCQGSVRGR